MPNVGKPSQDCHLCRRRRVKCDLGRPKCQRCLKYGAECPGYRDKKEFVFRNTYADAEEGSRIRCTSPGTSEPCSLAPAGVATGPVRPPHGRTEPLPVSTFYNVRSLPALLPPAASVKEQWTAHSIPLVMECFSSLPFFTRLLGSVPEGHPLALVSHVFARTYMGNRYNAPRDKREVSTYLGNSLQAVQAAINDDLRCKEDATIAAVWLLGLNEARNSLVLVGGFEKRGSDPNALVVHFAGLTSLLRNRGLVNLADPFVRQMFWTIYNTIQIQCMISNVRCPADLTVWLNGLQAFLTPEEETLLNVARFISTACSLFELAMPLIVDSKFPEACEVYPDTAYLAEEAEVMSPWMPQQPRDGIYRGYRTSWCGCRIKLNYVIILLSSLVEHAPNSPYSPEALTWQRRQCLYNTACISADIIEGLPILLGGCASDLDLDSPSAGYVGMRLVWPLTSMFMIPTVPAQHRAVAKDALLKIGRDLGVLQALRGYTGYKRFPREALSDIDLDETVLTDGYLPAICSPSIPDPIPDIRTDDTSK
ncbi:hypothetical protein GQ53DRAFT_727545 [Thozetella sp. PMI_491]|nr:hypothetical protein GQ53DRAFT_727545 [Thozetella sp. PMI_491]